MSGYNQIQKIKEETLTQKNPDRVHAHTHTQKEKSMSDLERDKMKYRAIDVYI